MTSYKEPLKIHITMSPKELRDLADKCEQKASAAKIGNSCFVDFLAHNQEYIILLNFDQERTKGSSNYNSEL